MRRITPSLGRLAQHGLRAREGRNALLSSRDLRPVCPWRSGSLCGAQATTSLALRRTPVVMPSRGPLPTGLRMLATTRAGEHPQLGVRELVCSPEGWLFEACSSM